MKEAIGSCLYPEILKFCEWFKKQQEEKGLQYVHLSLRKDPSAPSSETGGLIRSIIASKNSPSNVEVFDPKDFANLFGTSLGVTSQIAEELRGYVASCSKTETFDYFEKVCAEFNHIEDLIAQGVTKQVPGVF